MIWVEQSLTYFVSILCVVAIVLCFHSPLLLLSPLCTMSLLSGIGGSCLETEKVTSETRRDSSISLEDDAYKRCVLVLPC